MAKKIIISLCFLFFCTHVAIASNSNSNLSNKLQLQDASSVSKKANDTQFGNNPLLNNPLYNATTSGVGNFMHGITDNPINSYSMQEQSRQQMEYIQQGSKE